MTKTLGVGTASGSLQYSQRGSRDRARAMLWPDDLVVIGGTIGGETFPEERGMILGLMEPTTTIVSSLDYDLARGPRDYDESGNLSISPSRWRWTNKRPFNENRAPYVVALDDYS